MVQIALSNPFNGGEDQVRESWIRTNDERFCVDYQRPWDRPVYEHSNSDRDLYWLCDAAHHILRDTKYRFRWENSEAVWIFEIEDTGAALLFKLAWAG